VTHPHPIQPVKDALVQTAGGFLRNLVTKGTCRRCFTPILSGQHCSKCGEHLAIPGIPDLLGFMTYAGHLSPISQSGYTMRGYKNPAIPQSGGPWQTVVLLAALGLQGHRHCPGKILGINPSGWATVPSLPPKPQPHPLNEMARSLARSAASEIVLQGSTSVADARAVNRDHFKVVSGDPSGRHILLVDDTWTGGGHLMSAALALRKAGASHVSALLLARWLTEGFGATTPRWARDNLTLPDYQADICPWTQGDCP
jgi:hypothetical protein